MVLRLLSRNELTCVICKGVRQADDMTNVVNVVRGLPTLIKCSLLRKDGLAEVFKNVDSIAVHVECRKQYTRLRPNKFGVEVPARLNLKPQRPKTGVEFVFTTVPERSNEIFKSGKDTNVVTETINHNNYIKIEHSTNENHLSESIDPASPQHVAEHNESFEISLPNDVNTSQLKYNFKNEDSSSDRLENEPNGISMTEHDLLLLLQHLTPDYDDPTKRFPFRNPCAEHISNKNILKTDMLKRGKAQRVTKKTRRMRVLKKCSHLSTPKYDLRSDELDRHKQTYSAPHSAADTRPAPPRDKRVRRLTDGSVSDAGSVSGAGHLSRDEKRAKALGIPMEVHDIINLPIDEFNERLSKHKLSEAQLSLIRVIRRRGKNKISAQNSRERNQRRIASLADEVRFMKERKHRTQRDHHTLQADRQRVKERCAQLYRHVFQSLRDGSGRPLSSAQYSLQQAADGSVVLVPKMKPHNQ